jgi:hypothetical protein
MTLRRDWSQAQHKRGPCVVCGKTEGVELAHTIGCARDEIRRTPAGNKIAVVHPDSVVSLCGPSVNTGTCHNLYDHAGLDLWSFLSPAERRYAIGRVGEGEARRRISGRAWLEAA